jgi:hypothetical protein
LQQGGDGGSRSDLLLQRVKTELERSLGYEGSRRTKLFTFQIWVWSCEFWFRLCFAKIWVCKIKFCLQSSHFRFGARTEFNIITRYTQNGRYRQQVKPTHIARYLPHSATHPDHRLQNGQLVAHRINFALVAVAQQRAQPPHQIFAFSHIFFCNPFHACISC